MSHKDNALGDRGKALEDKWAREQDAKAIEAMRNKAAGGCKGGADCKGKGGKGCGCKDCGCGKSGK